MGAQIYSSERPRVCAWAHTLIMSSELFSTAFSLSRMKLSLVEIIDSSLSRDSTSLSILMCVTVQVSNTCVTCVRLCFRVFALSSIPVDVELQCSGLLLVRQ